MPNDYGIDVSDEAARELTRLLLGSVDRLVSLDQYNSFVRLQAIDNPFLFITNVAKHADALEREDESKGLFHLRITGITPEGSTNRIACIKILRQMFGWGLADSKVSFEALPGSGHEYSKTTPTYCIVSREFSTQESLMESKEWEDLQTGKHFFMFDMVRLPNGTPASKPFNPPR